MKIRQKQASDYSEAKKKIQFILGYDINKPSNKIKSWMNSQPVLAQRQRIVQVQKQLIITQDFNLKTQGVNQIKNKIITEKVSKNQLIIDQFSESSNVFEQKISNSKIKSFDSKFNKLQMRLNKLVTKVEDYRKSPLINKSSKSYRKLSNRSLSKVN